MGVADPMTKVQLLAEVQLLTEILRGGTSWVRTAAAYVLDRLRAWAKCRLWHRDERVGGGVATLVQCRDCKRVAFVL
jgi:hypothetical protein